MLYISVDLESNSFTCKKMQKEKFSWCLGNAEDSLGGWDGEEPTKWDGKCLSNEYLLDDSDF